MQSTSTRLLFFFAILASFSLLIFTGCGDDGGSAGSGSYDATLSGDVSAQVSGTASFRPNVAPLNNFVLTIGPQSDAENTDPTSGIFLLRLSHLDGIPPVGTYEINTASIMEEEMLNLDSNSIDFWDQGNRYTLSLAEGQEVTITSSSSSLVEGNFTADVTITPIGSSSTQAGTLQVGFRASPE